MRVRVPTMVIISALMFHCLICPMEVMMMYICMQYGKQAVIHTTCTTCTRPAAAV